MRALLLVLPLLLGTVPAAQSQVSVGIGIDVPGLSIGIHLPAYPVLQRVPGYPVYYAPQAPTNYFFYDGLYWVLQDDEWYSSAWYNGPWRSVTPYDVPVFVLRVPVRYYRQPPPYFAAWRPDAAPRWDERWGRQWQQRRPDWDRWDHRAAPPPAPLPDYQRKYPLSRYPQEVTQQQVIRSENYRYRPREPVARQFEDAPANAAPRRFERPERQAMPPPRMQPQPAPVVQPHPQPQRPQAAPSGRGEPAGRAEPPGREHDRKDDARGHPRDDKKRDRDRGN